MHYDMVIVGGGPAGLSAGLYGARAGLSVLLLEEKAVGGQALLTDRIENYPGFPKGITGPELMDLFHRQVCEQGIEIRFEKAQKVTPAVPRISVETKEGHYQAGTVIIASGARQKRLGVPGEESLLGKGVSYCATCDGAFFEGLKVLVVGGGDTAVTEALYLANIAREVVIVHRRDRLRAAAGLVQRAAEHPRIRFLLDTVVEGILGEELIEEVLLKNLKTGDVRPEKADGVFIFVGLNPITDFVRDTVRVTDQGYIITDERLETSVKGIFAAGDVRDKNLRQIVTAVSDGALAAIMAAEYLTHR